MSHINSNYLKLPGSYLFANIARQISEYLDDKPDADIIRLGIGDVTLPISPVVIKAMHKAVDEMAEAKTFHGYGPEQGYDFLINAIIKYEYESRGVMIDKSEVFVSDGSKCDVGNIQEIFDIKSTIAIGDPVYPVYLDSNVMAGRTGEIDDSGYFADVVYMASTKENNFSPKFPEKNVNLIYLCSPNNPTGATLTREELKKWVDYAKKTGAVILYDSAYSAYIRDESLPRSIYEIEGAKEVAIEFKSLSKTAGFTGVRCAFTVVPQELFAFNDKGEKVSLNKLWNRRQTTKFNGVSYIVQRAAEAVYSDAGMAEVKELIAYYMTNADIIVKGLRSAGFEVYGGENAPYIWWKLPEGIKSWDFLSRLLKECEVVGTPGEGFGPCGEGYFRLTAFGNRERTIAAIERIVKNKDKLSQ